MSGYIGNIPVPQATQTRDVFTATSGQTSFATSGYTPGFLDVWLNGVKLVNGTDFTATNGSDVVLASGAATSDIVEVLSYSTYEVNAQTYTGGLTAKNDGAAAITANRVGSDGAVVDLQRSGSSFGSVGVLSGFPYIGGGDTGMMFVNSDDTIRPHNIATNTARDNAIDLGEATVRWRNLYLSGGVYLGGTGGENYLDDYEEGTWTPNFAVNGFTQTISSTSGTYTKVGRHVTVTWKVTLSSSGYMSGYSLNTNLPFAVFSSQSTATGFYGTGDISGNTIGSSGYTEGSTANLYLYPSISTTNSPTWEGTHTYFTS